MDPRVVEANRNARQLLSELHAAHLEYSGSCWAIDHEGSTLDERAWDAAAQRLIERRLAKWLGMGSLTLTPTGVQVAEDQRALDVALPIESRPPAITPSVAAEAREIEAADLGFMRDPRLRKIVERDRRELAAAITAGLHKSVALLAGTVTEALLLDVCERNRTVAQSYMKKGRFPDDASLTQLTTIALEERLLSSSLTGTLSELRNHRDLIHPHREREDVTDVDAIVGQTLVHLLKLVARDLAASHADGRLEEYASK